jgi:hypothetical protein
VEGGDIRRVAWLCTGILGAIVLSAGVKFVLNYRLSGQILFFPGLGSGPPGQSKLT